METESSVLSLTVILENYRNFEKHGIDRPGFGSRCATFWPCDFERINQVDHSELILPVHKLRTTSQGCEDSDRHAGEVPAP